MKKNSKAFALIETLIVSIVVSTILIYIYVQYSNLQNNYDESFRYNDVDNLYQLREIKEYINSRLDTYKNDILNEINTNSVFIISKENLEFNNASNYDSIIFNNLNIKTLIITKAEVIDIDTTNLSNNVKNMLKRVNNKSSNHRLIAEYEDGSVATMTFKLEVLWKVGDLQ